MRSDRTGAAQRSIDFAEWLEVNFDLNNFQTAVITRKAEEVFLATKKQPMPAIADSWLRIINKWTG